MPPKIDVIVCECVREEIGNKQTFVGVFGPEVYLNDIPGILPQMAVVFRVRVTPESMPSEMTFEVRYTDEDAQSVTITSDELGDRMNGSKGDASRGNTVQFNFVLQFIPFKVEKEGVLSMAAVVDGKRKKVDECKFVLNK